VERDDGIDTVMHYDSIETPQAVDGDNLVAAGASKTNTGSLELFRAGSL
jgi:hypothetical protein